MKYNNTTKERYVVWLLSQLKRPLFIKIIEEKKRKCRRVKSICRTRPHECLVDQRISRAKARYWLAWKRHSAIDSTMETCGFWTTDRQIANNLILVSDLVALVPISRDTRIAPSRWKHKWKKKINEMDWKIVWSMLS